MAVTYKGPKPGKDAKVFVHGRDRLSSDYGLANIVKVNAADNPDDYTPYRIPTSDGSGELFYTKYDKDDDTDYLYSAHTVTKPVKKLHGGIGGGGSILSGNVRTNKVYDFEQTTTFTRVGPAPGENPPGTRQPEKAVRRKTGETKGGGGSYATKRNRAGARGTILTGAQGLLGSGSGGAKTLLGS